MANPRSQMGISTGNPIWDRAIGGGLRGNSVDVIAARAKTGKTMLVDNTALHISGQQIPVFNLDTEMNWEEHLHRIIGNLAGVEIRDIETGKCGINGLSQQQVVDAREKLKTLPYYYECVIGKQFEDLLASMRRWVTRTVGLEKDGKAKPCVIIYDYLKLMSSDSLVGDMKEYQALGFIMTALKNFMGRYNVPCLCFAQLNREGIDGEDESALAGSDRIVHYCTSLSFYKKKTPEEIVESPRGPKGETYTHKLLPIVSRHGEGLQGSDYINVVADYKRGRIIEGPTRNQLESGKAATKPQGIIVDSAPQEQISLAS